MTTDTELKTYRGNCHCGSYVYEVTVPELKSVTVCDCSICTKKNYMYLFLTPGSDSFKVVKDDGLLTDYSFAGSFGISHRFCSKCGVSVGGTSKNGMVVNARTLQDVNLWDVEIKTCDGASLDPQYEPPAYTGPEPTLPAGLDPESTPVVNGGKTYHGSCHCGAITAAVKLPQPLEDKDLSKERIVECNCSICMRGGFQWIYPLRSQVILHDTTTNTDPGMGTASSTLRSYAFERNGTRLFVKTFCSVCGVYFTNEFNTSFTAEEVAALPEESKAFRERMKGFRPFNLRVLNNFDFKTLGEPGASKENGGRIERLDGASRPPFYVNP